MNAMRIHLKHKIIKEVRLILTLIAVPMAFFIYFVMLKPMVIEDAPSIYQSEQTPNKTEVNYLCCK